MPASLIVGPPNSGRAGHIRARLEEALDREPVLVVPTADDASDFERRLSADGRSSFGVSIRTFRWLADDLATVVGAGARPPLSDAQRLALVRAAVRETPLRGLAGSAARRGFPVALDRLIDELQAALISPHDMRAAADGLEDGGHEAELAALYATYEERREMAARDDRHAGTARTIAGLRADPAAWGTRPVFLYGFDDLTEEQLELLRALARSCEVTIAVNYADGEALKARAGFVGRLVEALDAERPPELPFDPTYTESPVLRALDRGLFEPTAEPVEPDDGLALIEAAGERGAAEAISIEIARLLAGGASPDEIVVVLRRPERNGRLLQQVLADAGIPPAVEAAVPLSQTGVGAGLVALARAAGPEGRAADLLAYERMRPGESQGIADWLERRLRRGGPLGAAEAMETWEAPPRAIERLQRAATTQEWLRALAICARELAEEPHERAEPTGGNQGRTFEPLELRAGAAAADALEGLAELDMDISRGDALAALDDITVPLWRGPTEGRIRVVSPYRVRAARARHLFVCELQDGDFPGPGGIDPLLPDERRRALGMPALVRREASDEERYLFHACVSRPTERLWLVWRSADEEGHPTARSPFVDDVLDLLAGDRDDLEERLIRRRGLDRVVPDPGEASTARTLARALTAAGAPTDAESLERSGVQPATAGALAEAVARVTSMPEDTEERRPGPLRGAEVLGELAARRMMGAGTLEQWIECPYRWFVQHELRPERLDGTAEPLAAGSIVHWVLEKLYREPPGTDSIPRSGDVERWKERARELLKEALAGGGELEPLPPGPAAEIAAGRMLAQIEGFIDAESRSEAALRPLLFEAAFGEGTDDDRPLLDLGGLELHGKIDRVDVTPEGTSGVVHDYKTSREVTPAARLSKDGKLQLQLYAHAARELWGIEPLGGLYHPLGGRGERNRRGRGFVDAGSDALDGLDLVSTDRVPNARCEDVNETIDAAIARALEVADELRRGLIGRRPNRGACPRWCRFQPICRLERSLGPGEESESEANGDG